MYESFCLVKFAYLCLRRWQYGLHKSSVSRLDRPFMSINDAKTPTKYANWFGSYRQRETSIHIRQFDLWLQSTPLSLLDDLFDRLYSPT